MLKYRLWNRFVGLNWEDTGQVFDSPFAQFERKSGDYVLLPLDTIPINTMTSFTTQQPNLSGVELWQAFTAIMDSEDLNPQQITRRLVEMMGEGKLEILRRTSLHEILHAVTVADLISLAGHKRKD